MRLAIISDVHANLQALEAVLAHIEARGVDAVLCCGDVVGYGADPGPCVDLVRARCSSSVLGNHDLAVATGEGLSQLPPDGRIAALLHQELLSDDQRAWLSELPELVTVFDQTLVHATPRQPRSWARLDKSGEVTRQFDHFDTDLCFLGHTHSPVVVADRTGVFSVRAGRRYLVNVGSVGQPRDGDPRACVGYLEREDGKVAYALDRVAYNVDGAGRAIRSRGLPEELGSRLHGGR